MERESDFREGLSPELVNTLKAFIGERAKSLSPSNNNIYNTIITFASQ